VKFNEKENPMSSTCACGSITAAAPTVTTFDIAHLLRVQSASQQSLARAFPAAQPALGAANLLSGAALPAGTGCQVHMVSDGAMLISTSQVVANQGHLVLTGSIGPLPYEIDLDFSLDGSTITVTLQVKKPIPLGPYTWTYHLGGLTVDAAGKVVSATSVVPVDLNTPASVAVASGINWLCVLKCGGTTILPILIQCLPSLVGGAGGYIACVIASAGSAAASIAACIAKDCVG
jgi:hypothetical protein